MGIRLRFCRMELDMQDHHNLEDYLEDAEENVINKDTGSYDDNNFMRYKEYQIAISFDSW